MNSLFLQPNDPRLLQASEPVPVDAITGPQTQRDLEYMYSVAYPEQGDRSKPILVGVSASQLGIPRRIVLIDVAADGHGGVGDLRTYINPVITHHSDEKYDWYEGCYSTAPICGVVSRPMRITIEAYDAEGRPIVENHEGYIARIFQHEIDHLDGRVFIDRIADDNQLHWVEGHDYPQYRDQEGWRNWPKKYPRDRWTQTKNRPLVKG
jgi:peptide deformylase